MSSTNIVGLLSAPAIQLDHSIYTADSEKLMRQRGIVERGETIQTTLVRVTQALLDMDRRLSGTTDHVFHNFVIELVNKGIVVYGTPVLTNAGREQKITAGSMVLPLRIHQGRVDMEHFAALSNAALESAVGTGYDVSETDSPTEALAALNECLDRINERLVAQKQRPVASMVTLRVNHPKVREFIRSKREADFSKGRFNISVFVTEDFFRAAEQGLEWELKDSKGNTTERCDASALLREIADCAHYCGEPGILFKDRIDVDNPTPQWEYKSTAPCAEVAMAPGEACHFSYINVAKLITEEGFNGEGFGKAVRAMTRLLDAGVEYTICNRGNIYLPLVEPKRRIGVGITGFADLLIELKIPYDSRDAVDLAAKISELLDYHSKVESVELARKRGAFPAFLVSKFLNPEWNRRKLSRSTGIVAQRDWGRLFTDLSLYGIRHASTTSMPPTGTSSAIVGSSKSLEPHFSLLDHTGQVHRVVRRALRQRYNQDDAKRIYTDLSINGMLDEKTLVQLPFLRTARQISPLAHLRLQAGFQTFLDENLAKTVNLPQNATPDDVLEMLKTAYHFNLKGLTVFRDNCLSTRRNNRHPLATSSLCQPLG